MYHHYLFLSQFASLSFYICAPLTISSFSSLYLMSCCPAISLTLNLSSKIVNFPSCISFFKFQYHHLNPQLTNSNPSISRHFSLSPYLPFHFLSLYLSCSTSLFRNIHLSISISNSNSYYLFL